MPVVPVSASPCPEFRPPKTNFTTCVRKWATIVIILSREVAVHKRSGVARKPVVPPAEPCRDQWRRRTLSASPHKDEICPTTKQRLRRNSSPVAGALYHGRGFCSLSRKRSRRLVTTRDRNWAALRGTILSGIPTIPIPSFLHCPVSGPGLFLGAHSRAPDRCLWRARTFLISAVQHLRLARMGFPTSISKSLLKGAVQYGRENTCLVGPGRRSGRKTDSTGCEIGRPRDLGTGVPEDAGATRRSWSRCRAHGKIRCAGVALS